MTPFNLELGLSSSASSGAQAGLGDFIVNAGGGGSNAPFAQGSRSSSGINPWLIGAAALVVVAVAWLFFRRK